jgi:hypothetical protein
MGMPNRRNRRRSSIAQEGNPLKDDPTLRKQLMQLDRIKSNRKFEPWKNAFLKRFEEFLERDGVNKAEEAYSDFSKRMGRTVALVNKCEEMNQKGDLTNERATVKGRHALNEMVNDLTVGCAALRELIPGTGTEEEKRGYNKFMLGAILVRDNFSQYEEMKYVNDVIQVMSDETLTEVADRVHLEQFRNFQTQFNRFCDVLADLSLYEGTLRMVYGCQLLDTLHLTHFYFASLISVMMACRKFSDDAVEEDDSLTEEETEYESDEYMESIIIVDMKTASVFQMPLDIAFEKGIIIMATRTDDSGATQDQYIKETCNSEEEREEIKTKLKNHPTLGVATQLVTRKSVAIEYECTELKEKEAVSSMWGITLKSTNKKAKKNEELFFFDPYTGAVGELDRSKALARGCIHEERNQFDALVLTEAEEDPDEWESIRGKIRKIVGIQMDEERDDSSSSVRFSGAVVPATA